MHSLLIWAVPVTMYVSKLPCPLQPLSPLRYLTSCPPTLNSSFLPLSFSLFSFWVLPSLIHPFHLNSFSTDALQTTLLFFTVLLNPTCSIMLVSNDTHTTRWVFTLLFVLLSSSALSFIRIEVCFLDADSAVTIYNIQMYTSGRVLFSPWLNWNYFNF